MGLFKKIGLYLSSFSPLFALLIVKELIEILNQNWSFNFLNTSMLLLLFVLLIIGVSILFITISQIRLNRSTKIIKVISKTNVTDEHFLGYFSLFVLFAVSFEIEMYSMALIFFLVLTFIGIVYIKNDMYYINPLINLFGYSFYDIEYKDLDGDTKNMRVFFKGKLNVNKKYTLNDKYSNFVFIV